MRNFVRAGSACPLLAIILLLSLTAYGQQQERVAIINTVDDRDSIGTSDLAYLTGRLRETAVKVLSKSRYGVMTTETIVAFLGSQEQAAKECKAASCLAELGRKVNADYVAQAHIGRFGKQLSINFELYNSKSGNLIGSFMGNSKDIFGLLAIIDEKAPDLFKQMPGVSGGSPSPSVAGGISGLQKTAAYEADDEKRYLVNLNTEPLGVALSFDGVPSCPKTPCKVELREGSVRIIAALEQYETTDTVVSIKQNNQNIVITLKPNFGILEMKPTYSDGIGSDKQWDLTINGKPYSLGEVRLSPNKYSVRLNHECYENIGFDVGINKGKREIFDMASNITLKNGGLALSAERDGEPVSEPVFVNGKRVGETPFNGTVPICAKVEIGNGKEAVDVKLKYNEKVKYTHNINEKKAQMNSCDSEKKKLQNIVAECNRIGRYKQGYNECIEFNVKAQKNKAEEICNEANKTYGEPLIDNRDGKKYKTVVIGKQTWMAENLNYNASGSKCYDNKPSRCDTYGRLYNWETAKKSCPKGWHLPSTAEWKSLTAAVGGEKTGGKFLKATSGWSDKDYNGSGNNMLGFEALSGGSGVHLEYSQPNFKDAGYYGRWWLESNGNGASWSMFFLNDVISYGSYYRHDLFSVRCVKD